MRSFQDLLSRVSSDASMSAAFGLTIRDEAVANSTYEARDTGCPVYVPDGHYIRFDEEVRKVHIFMCGDLERPSEKMCALASEIAGCKRRWRVQEGSARCVDGVIAEVIAFSII